MAGRNRARPTLADVSRASGVSTAAVSYVLNNRTDKSITTATRTRVLAAAAELGYVPNAAAASLRRGHSNVVMLVTDATLAGETGARLVGSMATGVTELGYAVVTYMTLSDERLCEAVAAVQPLAVILATFVSKSTHARLSAMGVRHVIGLMPKADDAEDGDRFWEQVIGEAQVRHLAELGHERIGFVLPDPASPRRLTARARLAGAEAECAAHRLGSPVAVSAALDRRAVAAELSALRADGVTAVCAHDNRTAVATLAGMSDLGWSAPADLAVVGVGDTWHARLTTPLLSVVRMRGMYLDQETAGLLRAAISGERADATAALRAALPPAEAVRRGTT